MYYAYKQVPHNFLEILIKNTLNIIFDIENENVNVLSDSDCNYRYCPFLHFILPENRRLFEKDIAEKRYGEIETLHINYNYTSRMRQ